MTPGQQTDLLAEARDRVAAVINVTPTGFTWNKLVHALVLLGEAQDLIEDGDL